MECTSQPTKRRRTVSSTTRNILLKIAQCRPGSVSDSRPCGDLSFNPIAPDLARLDDDRYLNDTLIDGFLDHIKMEHLSHSSSHVFSSLFCTRLSQNGWKGVQTWTRKLQRQTPAGLFAKHYVFVPMHDAKFAHWWLAIVKHPWAAADLQSKNRCDVSTSAHGGTVGFLDSCQGQGLADEALQRREDGALQMLRDYFAEEWFATMSPEAGGFDPQRLVGQRLTVPQQKNTADCGVFILEFARHLLRDPNALEALFSSGTLDLVIPAQPRERWRRIAKSMKSRNGGFGRMRSCLGSDGEGCAIAAAQGHGCPQPQLPGSRGNVFGSRTPQANVPIKQVVILWLSEAARRSLTSRQRQDLGRLGAKIATDGSLATHVVVDGDVLKRTLRVMLAVCRGQHVVTRAWLATSIAGGCWAREERHQPVPPWDGGYKWNLQDALSRARKRPLFFGYSVYIFPSVAERIVVTRIVESGGGRLLHDWSEVQSCDSCVILVSSSATDGQLSGDLPLLVPELIFESAMSQRLCLTGPEHRLHEGASCPAGTAAAAC